jgi:lysophospholipase L1-like esterase
MNRREWIFRFLLLSISGSVALVLGDRLLGLTGMERFQTWLELHPDGFMMNQKGGTAWQEFQGEQMEYTFKMDRTRLSGEPDSGRRVLLLGDSFCFGLYLPDSSAPAFQLNRLAEAQDAGFYTVNAGVGGTGTADHLALLELFAGDWRPDLVVLMLNADDADRAMAKNLFVLKGDSLVRSRRWRASPIQERWRSLPGHRWFEKHSYIYSALQKVAWNTIFFEDSFKANVAGTVMPAPDEWLPESGYVNRLMAHLLERMKRVSVRHGADFAVFYNGMTHPDSASVYTRHFLKNAPELLSGKDIPYYDATPAWRLSSMKPVSAYRLYPDSHPNHEGAAGIARELFRFITVLEQENRADR